MSVLDQLLDTFGGASAERADVSSGIWGSSTPFGQQPIFLLTALPDDGPEGVEAEEIRALFAALGMPANNVDTIDEAYGKRAVDILTDRNGRKYWAVDANTLQSALNATEVSGFSPLNCAIVLGPTESDGSRGGTAAKVPGTFDSGQLQGYWRSWDYNPTSTARWYKSERSGQYYVFEETATTEKRRGH